MFVTPASGPPEQCFPSTSGTHFPVAQTPERNSQAQESSPSSQATACPMRYLAGAWPGAGPVRGLPVERECDGTEPSTPRQTKDMDGLIGLAAAIGIGALIYAGGSRVNLKTFFNVTAVLLLLFAAGLAGKALHELRELIGWESGWLIESAWTIESGILAKGTTYDFLRGLFGWSESQERLRVLAYFAYLIPIMMLYRRKVVEVAPEVVQAKA